MDPVQKSSTNFSHSSRVEKKYSERKGFWRKLQEKWKVSGTQLFLIFCVFAITGTTTAYLTKMITQWFRLDSSSAWYWVGKIGMLVFGYQVLILLISIPFGQFPFFWNYEKKILRRFGIRMKKRNPDEN